MTVTGFRRLGRRAPRRADRPVPHAPAEAPARPRASGRRTSRSSRSSRAACGLRTRAHARLRRVDGLALPPLRRDPHTGDPDRMILEDMDLDGIDVQLMHPNLSLFGLYSDDHELSIAHARVYNDYVVERFTPLLRAASRRPRRSRSPTSTTRSPRSSASPRPGSARSCCPRCRRCRTSRASSTRCGPRRRPTACTCSSTRDRRREGRRRGVDRR